MKYMRRMWICLSITVLLACIFVFQASAQVGDPCTVSFNPNGGSCAVKSIAAVCGEPYGRLPIPARDNYVFMGWYTLPISGDKITSDVLLQTAPAQTLYAHWEGKTCTVTFNGNGGLCLADSKTVRYGDVYGELPEAERVGYQFAGWFTQPKAGYEVTPDTEVTNSMNHALYPHWTPKTYTLYFDSDGGACSVTSMTVTYGAVIGELPVPSKTGYVFNGWFDMDGVMQYQETTVYNDIFSAYAKAVWTPVQAAEVQINNNPGLRIIDYRSTLVLRAAAENLPPHAQIAWFENEQCVAFGEVYTKTEAKSDFTVTARVVDTAGNILTNADGTQIEDQQVVHVNGGFFRVLIAFFKWLFGNLPVISQAIQTL